MLNTLAHYLISFISTMNIKKQQAHYRYMIYIQYVLYSCITYHVMWHSFLVCNDLYLTLWNMILIMLKNIIRKLNSGSILISQMFAPVPQFWQQLTSAWDKNGTKIKQRGKNNDYKTETKQRNYLETEIHRKYIFQNISKSFRTSKLDWTLSYLVSSPRLTSACGFLQ